MFASPEISSAYFSLLGMGMVQNNCGVDWMVWLEMEMMERNGIGWLVGWLVGTK
jgi:hypothetical protein